MPFLQDIANEDGTDHHERTRLAKEGNYQAAGADPARKSTN